MNDTLIVRERLQEVVPHQYLEDMSVTEVEKAVRVAFEIIGYTPSSEIKDLVEDAWTVSGAVLLWEFIFDVYEVSIHGYD